MWNENKQQQWTDCDMQSFIAKHIIQNDIGMNLLFPLTIYQFVIYRSLVVYFVDILFWCTHDTVFIVHYNNNKYNGTFICVPQPAFAVSFSITNGYPHVYCITECIQTTQYKVITH